MPHDPIHSTGRGGAGNIGPDPNTYVEGDIVREGVAGQPGHLNGGDYSAGRGGVGNMVPSPSQSPRPGKSPQRPPPTKNAESADAIPETAMREQTPEYANYHTGRGGGGNVHKDKYGGHSTKREQDESDKAKGEDGKTDGFFAAAKHAMGIGGKKPE